MKSNTTKTCVQTKKMSRLTLLTVGSVILGLSSCAMAFTCCVNNGNDKNNTCFNPQTSTGAQYAAFKAEINKTPLHATFILSDVDGVITSPSANMTYIVGLLKNKDLASLKITTNVSKKALPSDQHYRNAFSNLASSIEKNKIKTKQFSFTTPDEDYSWGGAFSYSQVSKNLMHSLGVDPNNPNAVKNLNRVDVPPAEPIMFGTSRPPQNDNAPLKNKTLNSDNMPQTSAASPMLH